MFGQQYQFSSRMALVGRPELIFSIFSYNWSTHDLRRLGGIKVSALMEAVYVIYYQYYAASYTIPQSSALSKQREDLARQNDHWHFRIATIKFEP